jgi:transglutaminase-like putative cysteine protease
VREERIVIRRGATTVRFFTDVTITFDDRLRAERIEVNRRQDDSILRGTATRDHGGDWLVQLGAEPARRIDGTAVPMEALPLLLSTLPERRFEGTALLAGHGFATAEVYVRPTIEDARRLVTTLVVPAGVLSSELVLADTDRGPELIRVEAPGSVEAVRASAAAAAAPFDPPELVDTTSIAVAGTVADAAPGNEAITRLIVDGVAGPAPPALPGQLVRVVGRRWQVTLAPGFSSAAIADRVPLPAPHAVDADLGAIADAVVARSGARAAADEVRALVAYTDRTIDDDLAPIAPDARTALALGRGDCTAHAALFASLATARGFEVWLVTGYRLGTDEAGSRLWRHRWALVELEDRWIAVDPTYGEAPARAVNLGLAIHGASAADMALVDELVFAGFRAATARFR